MKVTKERLSKIIKEEIEAAMEEGFFSSSKPSTQAEPATLKLTTK